MTTYRFFGKNVNSSKYAAYDYIGSMTITETHKQALIDCAYSIGGPIYGPLIAVTENPEDGVIVLQV